MQTFEQPTRSAAGVSAVAKPTVLIIAGPTASGKSATAIQVAQAIHGEIISADSMQLYRGMDIGTAKVTLNEQQQVRHHLIDILDQSESFSVAAWQAAAVLAIDDILSRGHVPIICGGTGQYISSLMEGLTFAPVPSDPELRMHLNTRAEVEGTGVLLAEIAAFDPATASRLHENDRKRIIRALEIYQLTGRTTTEVNEQSHRSEPIHQYIGFCLWPDRDLLYDRINRRVNEMLSLGLVEEVRRLSLNDLPDHAPCRQAIGYKEVFQFLSGIGTLEEVSERIKISTRHYAKRQLTWFRRMEQLIHVTAEDPVFAAQFILKFRSISDISYCVPRIHPVT